MSGKRVELPLEYTFFFEDAKVDLENNNRYIFEFPKEWKTTLMRDPMIGIRKISIPKAYRHPSMTFMIRTAVKKEGTITYSEQIQFPFSCYIDENEDLRKLRNLLLYEYSTQIIAQAKTDVYDSDGLVIDIEYGIESGRPSFIQKFFMKDQGTTEKWIEIQFTNMNKDLCALLNHPSDTTSTGYCKILEFPDVWDRHECMVCASFCNLSKRHYLGFTDEGFRPIKYFRLNTNTNTFWIEFWNSRNRDVPNVLPVDGKDGLFIEATLLESGDEMH